MNRVNAFVRQHFEKVEWYVSLIGAAGLGYVFLSAFKIAMPLAMGLVMVMACVKAYLGILAEGRAVPPVGKSAAYMVAWWVLFGLVLLFLVLSLVALGLGIWAAAS